ncbi:hypothetical protein BDR03DRAFT_936749 [Suillus americanus]|nr:hypothetical protein BDR03DRAFT_936749 [Suillus americanus]
MHFGALPITHFGALPILCFGALPISHFGAFCLCALWNLINFTRMRYSQAYELTDPANFPQNDTADPHPLPMQVTPSQLLETALRQIIAIASNPAPGNDTCTKCQASLAVAKMLILGAPEQGPLLAQAVCQYFNYSMTCYNEYSELALVVLCNTTGWFATPKLNPLPPPIQPSGEHLKVFHISDIHLNPRYAIGSKANCTAYMCCHENVFNAASPNQLILPPAHYGSYWCDTPLDLMAVAMQAISPITGTEGNGFNFSIFTSDLTAHDPDNQYSRFVVFHDLLKRYVGPTPVYATIGNHDTYMQFQMIPYTMGGALGVQFNWLYEHISSMWEYEGWVPEVVVTYASTHYTAYAVTCPDGLKIISLDTNLCEIIDHFSPHVIASDYWLDSCWHYPQIFYANNGTVMTAETALAAPWIMPSLTPLTNLSSGFYVNWCGWTNMTHISKHYSYFSNINEFQSLDGQTEVGPSYHLEYSARDAYRGNITWGVDDPLNATWWHLTFNMYQLKSSVAGLNCTGECIPAKIYYMRSGNCITGYSSMQ